VLQEYLTCGSETYEQMVEVIRQDLKLTSLKFQKLESLIKAIGIPGERVCTYCWNGRDVENEAPEFE